MSTPLNSSIRTSSGKWVCFAASGPGWLNIINGPMKSELLVVTLRLVHCGSCSLHIVSGLLNFIKIPKSLFSTLLLISSCVGIFNKVQNQHEHETNWFLCSRKKILDLLDWYHWVWRALENVFIWTHLNSEVISSCTPRTRAHSPTKTYLQREWFLSASV